MTLINFVSYVIVLHLLSYGASSAEAVKLPFRQPAIEAPDYLYLCSEFSELKAELIVNEVEKIFGSKIRVIFNRTSSIEFDKQKTVYFAYLGSRGFDPKTWDCVQNFPGSTDLHVKTINNAGEILDAVPDQLKNTSHGKYLLPLKEYSARNYVEDKMIFVHMTFIKEPRRSGNFLLSLFRLDRGNFKVFDDGSIRELQN